MGYACHYIYQVSPLCLHIVRLLKEMKSQQKFSTKIKPCLKYILFFCSYYDSSWYGFGAGKFNLILSADVTEQNDIAVMDFIIYTWYLIQAYPTCLSQAEFSCGYAFHPNNKFIQRIMTFCETWLWSSQGWNFRLQHGVTMTRGMKINCRIVCS